MHPRDYFLRLLRLFINAGSGVTLSEKRSIGTIYGDHDSHRERDSNLRWASCQQRAGLAAAEDVMSTWTGAFYDYAEQRTMHETSPDSVPDHKRLKAFCARFYHRNTFGIRGQASKEFGYPTSAQWMRPTSAPRDGGHVNDS